MAKAKKVVKKKPAKKPVKKSAKRKPAKKSSKPAQKPPKKSAAKKPAAKKSAAQPRPKPQKPSSEPSVERDKLVATLAAIAPRLAADPLYADEANAPFDADELKGYFEAAESPTLVELFGETLQGMIQSVRYSALHVVREVFRDDGQALITTKPSVSIEEGGGLAVIGDLVVEGDVENEGVLVVTGDLTIKGAYIGPAFDYSLAAVGGTLRARDVSSSGEILVGERLEASRIVHLLYNDYSSILPAVKAKALVIEDNYPALGTVEVELRVEDEPATPDQLRAIFGASANVDPTDEDESVIRRLIGS